MKLRGRRVFASDTKFQGTVGKTGDREPDSELGPWQQNASTAAEAPKGLNKELL